MLIGESHYMAGVDSWQSLATATTIIVQDVVHV